MSNRQRGSKTLSAEDEIIADSVDIVGTGLKFSGNGGTAGQVLQVDTDLSQKFQNLVISDNSVTTDAIEDGAVTGDKLADDSVNTDAIVDDSVTGDKLADNIRIVSSGYAQFTGEIAGVGLSITNDIDCANTIKTDNLDNRTGTNIIVGGGLELEADKSISTQGTGSITTAGSGNIGTSGSGNIVCASGNILASGGSISGVSLSATTGGISTTTNITATGDIEASGTIKTNTIDGLNPGSISVDRNLALTTNSLDTTSGNIGTTNGAISTTSGQISSDSGNIFTNSGNISTGGTLETNTIDGFVAGDISVNRNLELSTNELGTTSGNITSATGNIGTTSGDISTTSGNISCGGNLSTDTIQSNTGGATQIAINSDMAFDTNKSLFFVGTGGIGGGTSSNIQFNTGTFANIQGNNQETIQFSRTSINLRALSGTGGNITCDGGSVIFRNLPTSSSGLGSGQIYNDGGTLKIV